jgi:hypothetical protein
VGGITALILDLEMKPHDFFNLSSTTVRRNSPTAPPSSKRRFALRVLRYTTRIGISVEEGVSGFEVWLGEGDSGMFDSGSPLVPYSNTKVGLTQSQMVKLLKNRH